MCVFLSCGYKDLLRFYGIFEFFFDFVVFEVLLKLKIKICVLG